MIVNQRYDHALGCAVPEIPDCSLLLFPAANHYCLFDGGLGHGGECAGLVRLPLAGRAFHGRRAGGLEACSSASSFQFELR